MRFVWAELSDPAAMANKIHSAVARGRTIVKAGGVLGTWSADPALEIPR